MNFLILHNMGPRSRWLSSVADLELALPRYAPQHKYLVQNAWLPVPAFIKDAEYDAIIVNSTFIDLLSTPAGYENVKTNYAFLNRNPAFTIALPQDDYWCSEVRDEWFTETGIRRVHPVCAREHWELFYPRYMALGREMALGYTGYITPKLRQRAAFPKPSASRKYDVVYRAKGKPAYPNRLGNLKGQIGDRFERAFGGQPLVLDISTDPKDTIPGDGWLDFVENSRALLGSNSGSSLLVRNHEMVKKIDDFILSCPDASYDQIEQACFPGEDGKYEFSAISPRNFEAGLFKTLQILVPGPYGNILSPSEHYVPLAEDCSNKSEVMTVLNDFHLQDKIATACRDALLACRSIQIETFVMAIEKAVTEGLPSNHKSMAPDEADKIISRHNSFCHVNETILDALEAVKNCARNTLPPSALRLIRRLRGIKTFAA